MANKCGAYLIVSSTGSTSDAALQKRRRAMVEAVSDLHNRSSLTLDFYDRSRLATWVRDHPGLIPWVRTAVGKAIPGWSSYGAWAYAPDGISGEYLLDEKLRIQTGKKESDGGLRALEAIKQMRDSLREPGKAVRLIGLSGLGKTRLVQALFDDRVGENSLDPSLAIYTNMADEPDPQPTGLASDLIADHTRAIVVIDNCPTDLHRRISELCRSPASTVSVITIEYDIRDDEPEGTEVFELKPSSTELIERLVKHRFREISAVDAQTIAVFSDGNARIAIALAHTVGKNEKITGLSDEELFQRLFLQRHEPDPSLLLAAQACSLVYSFQGEDVSNDDQAELIRLGAMIGKSAEEVYRSVAELQRRGLVQQRGVWRAVLPHAIANRLASIALQNIPFATIEAQLIEGAPDRLLKSFSRRLGYLHDRNDAIAIVDRWLAADGLLGNVADLNSLGKAILNNVAPSAPETTLAAFERALLGPEGDKAVASCADYVHVIRSLAYDATLFERCVALLLKFAKGAGDDRKANEGSKVFVSLFFLYLSGTHATIEQRLSVIERLLVSDEVHQRSLSLEALKAALEAWHFSSGYHFDFGAWSRDHGYWPQSGAEVKHWFGSVLKLAETLACSDRPVAPRVCAAVADKFRGLWTMAGMYDELEHVCRAISGKKFWREGWIAVRQTLNFDSEGFTPEIVARLWSLEARLRPTDLVQKVRAIVLSEMPVGLDLGNFEAKGSDDLGTAMERTEVVARDLGKAVAADELVIGELVAELVSGRGRLWSFGQGLSEGTPDPKALWHRLVTQLAASDEGSQNIQILCGMLNALGENNRQLADALLDDAVQNETLAAWYPVLQTAVRIDRQDVDRLRRSLALGKAPIGKYESLAWGRATDPISGQDLKELLLTIGKKPDGTNVAVEILYMRLHSDDSRKQSHAPEIIDAGRELLWQLTFAEESDHEDHRLGTVSKACLVGKEGAVITQEICRKLNDSVTKYETYKFTHDGLLQALFSAQPAAALDGLCAGDAAGFKRGIRIIDYSRSHNKNPLDAVPEGELLSWCDQEPETRYSTAAALVSIFHGANEPGLRRWTSIALRLLEKAPDRIEVLRQFVRRFSPTSWSGSRATIMASNAKLLDELEGYADLAVAEFIAKEKARLNEEIEAERRTETLWGRAKDERFE